MAGWVWALLAILAILLLWKLLLSCYMRSHNEHGRLDGKVVLITGATDGIGKFALLQLIKRNPKKLIFLGRDSRKAEKVITECVTELTNHISHLTKDSEESKAAKLKLDCINSGKWKDNSKCFESDTLCFKEADLSDLDSVEVFAQYLRTQTDCIDILVANAGGLYSDRLYSKQNVEMTVASNYLGHFHLLNLILPMLVRPGESHNKGRSRIISLSSCMHWMTLWVPRQVKINTADIERSQESKYDYWYQYSTAKLMMNLLTKGLVAYGKQQHQSDSFPKAVSLFPGIILTAFNRGLPKLLFRLTEALRPLGAVFGNTVAQGAQTTLKLVLAAEESLVEGGYYSNCRLSTENPCVHDPKLVASFWNESLSLLRKKDRNVHLQPL